MAKNNVGSRQPMNLDYFPISTIHSEGDFQSRRNLTPLKTQATASSSTIENRRKSKQVSAFPLSPSDSSSSIASSWDLAQNSGLFTPGTKVSDTSSHLKSPRSPLTPLKEQQGAIIKAEPDTDIICSDSTTTPFNFDDWMSWERDEPTDSTWAMSPFPKLEPQSPQLSRMGFPSNESPQMTGTSLDASIFRDDISFNNIGPLYQDLGTVNQQETFPALGLYPTPLSWDSSRPGSNYLARPTELIPANAGQGECFNMNRTVAPLTKSEEAQLRAIAMPQLAMTQYDATDFALSDDSSCHSSPEAEPNCHKRKCSNATDESYSSSSPLDRGRSAISKHHETKTRPPPIKKTSHNMIEKRYRTNLNDKIAALRDSVPSLRAAARKEELEGNHEVNEDLQGLAPAHKLNKATVLSKATEYIAHLEKRTSELARDNEEMTRRLQAFEQLFCQQHRQGSRANLEQDGRESQRGHLHSNGR